MNMHSKCKKIQLIIIVSISICIIQIGLCSNSYGVDWQTTLELNFDYAESFDELKNWKGSNAGNIIKDDYPLDFPVRSDGDSLKNHPNAIHWNYYKYADTANNKFPLGEYAIQNHGKEWVWQGTGKSICIDYGQGIEQTDKGPDHWAFKIGDSPDDGYKDQCHAFWMQRFPSTFFERQTDRFEFLSFLKIFVIASGFKNPRQWGTDAESEALSRSSGQPCFGCSTEGQTRYVYGGNGLVFNYQPRSGVITTIISNHWLKQDDPCKYCKYDKEGRANNDTSGMNKLIWENEWFGVEVRYKLSNPHGTANGQFEVWIYNSAGENVEKGHVLFDNLITIADGTSPLNHSINKFNWAINRSGEPTYNDFKGCSEYFYIDDIIIDKDRIGPSYFSLLKLKPKPDPAEEVEIGDL